jgi:hypothetical protein
VSAAAEARTVVSPWRAGQILVLQQITYGGAVTITFPHGFNQTGNTVMTTDAVNDMAVLFSVVRSGAPTTFVWRLIWNDGMSLS